jgi:hypothetical protein
MGTNVAPILFKNVMMNQEVVRNVDQLVRDGYELHVTVQFEP